MIDQDVNAIGAVLGADHRVEVLKSSCSCASADHSLVLASFSDVVGLNFNKIELWFFLKFSFVSSVIVGGHNRLHLDVV